MPPSLSTSSAQAATDVLVVDDDPQFCRVFGRMLLRQGLTTLVCHSSLRAIRALEAAPYLVVVADLTMPGLDGAGLLRVVERRWPGTRRLIFSGHTAGSLVVANPQAHRVVDKSLPLSLVVEIILEELILAQP